MLMQNLSNPTVGDHIISFFSIRFTFNFWTFLLLIAYVGIFVFGYQLISGQVKLVKKEIWDNWDRLKCLVFAFFFANGIIIILAMMVTFTISSFRFSTDSAKGSPAFFILIPLAFCLFFITIYPLFDFLYMAMHDENVALSQFQELFEPFIKKFKKPLRLFVAFFLYLLCFLVPPILLMVIFKLGFIYVWISWQLLFPMFTLSYYGAKGYIIGIVAQYNSLPSIGRSSFLLFEPGTRLTDETLRNPVPRGLTWVMAYLYGWTLFSLVTSLGAINPNYNPPSTMSGITVYVVLFFGITGYFSRFWSRKIKISTMDLLFAAFLIAAIGVNVLTNFTLVNAEMLDPVFNQWTITQDIFVSKNELTILQNSGVILTGLQATGLNFKNFAIAAIIEETVLWIFMSIYLWKKPKTFLNDTVYAFITKSADIFDPIPAFNESRSSEKFQREHSLEILMKIYSRVPLKQGFNINDPQFVDPLFDAVCDYNPYARHAGEEVLKMLLKDHPAKIVNMIEKQIQSPNLDKVRIILQMVTKFGNKLIPLLSINILLDQLIIPEYHIKQDIVKILNQKMTDSSKTSLEKQQIDLLLPLLDDPDFDIQATTMEILGRIPNALPNRIIMERLNHPNPRIKTAATLALGSLDFSQMGEAAADTLISMLDSPNPQILASAMHTISQFKDLSKFKIPLQPFIENLINENENVQIAAGAYISRLLEMNTPNLKIEQYIPRFFDFSLGIQKNLLPLLGKCWKTVPEVLPLCIKVLRSDENEISEVASGVLSNLAKDSPEKIINLLLNEQETESFIRMGRISTALTKICKTIPEKGIQLMLSALTATNENVKINACSVLGALSSQYGKQIPLKPLLNIWFQDPNAKVKKEIAKAVSNIAAQQPDTIKPLMPTILKGVTDPDNSVRLTVAKLFVDLGEKSPDLIPFTAIKTMTEDKDAYIRENGLKLLAVTSKRFPKEAIQVVYQCLKDPEWNVKNAAADTFGKLSVNIDDADILNGLKQMITDKEKWVRIKGLGVIAKVIDNHPNLLSFKEITQMINTETDMDVLVNLAKIFGVIAASNFTQALPMILKLMSHPERNIREGMIAGMVGMSLKVPLSTLVPPLLKYFSDDSELVLQQSIALLLKRILRYEGEDLKLRVIPMLKIRCQVTQDPILSEVLSDLQASIKK